MYVSMKILVDLMNPPRALGNPSPTPTPHYHLKCQPLSEVLSLGFLLIVLSFMQM